MVDTQCINSPELERFVLVQNPVWTRVLPNSIMHEVWQGALSRSRGSNLSSNLDSTERKHQRKSMEARKCETGDANQISASMTKSKRTHRKKKHKMSYYPAWNKKRSMYSKLGLRLLGKMPPMVVKPYLVWGQFGSWEASPRRGNEKNLPLLCRKAIRIEPGSVFKKMPPVLGKSATHLGKISHGFWEKQAPFLIDLGQSSSLTVLNAKHLGLDLGIENWVYLKICQPVGSWKGKLLEPKKFDVETVLGYVLGKRKLIYTVPIEDENTSTTIFAVCLVTL